jgi:hypothetical protein
MKKLLLTLFFSAALYAQPSFTNLEDIAVYDDNNDGYAQFDLTANSSALLDGLNPDEHTISYFLTFNDADLNRNAIGKPNKFTNTIPNEQELYARITEKAHQENYSVDLFSIRMSNSKGLPIAANPKNSASIIE